MNASVAPILPPASPAPVVVSQPAAPLAAVHAVHAGEPAEIRRWLLMLGTPFMLSGIFFAAAIGAGVQWLMAPAMVVGPGLAITAFVYLGLTSEAEKPYGAANPGRD